MTMRLGPMDALASRRRVLQEAIDGEYVIFSEHDPSIATGIVRKQGNRAIVEPVVSD